MGRASFALLHPSRNTLLGLDLFSISPDGLEPLLLFSPPNGQAGRTRQRRPSIRDSYILLSLIWDALPAPEGSAPLDFTKIFKALGYSIDVSQRNRVGGSAR